MEHEMMEHEMEESMMKMTFHFGLGDTLLFPGLKLDTNVKLILACFLLFVLALINEVINYLRRIRCECELKPFKPGKAHDEHDHNGLTGSGDNHCGEQGQQQARETRLCCTPSTGGSSGAGCSVKHCEFAMFRSENKSYKIVQAIFYFFQTALALTLMLAAMTYNVCLIFAIVLGAGVGYYIFYRPNVDVEVCH